MGDASPQGKEDFQAIQIGGDALLEGEAAFVLDVGLDVSSGEVGRVCPETDEAVYGSCIAW